MGTATVAMGLLAGLVSFAESRGAQARILCSQAGIDLKMLDQPDRRVSIDVYMEVMRLAKSQTGLSAFALEFGKTVGMSELSIVGLLMEASETVGEAYIQMRRYGRLAIEIDQISDGPRFSLVHDENRLFLVDRQRSPAQNPELTESAFAWLTCGPRRYMDRSPVKSANFIWRKPKHWEAYERTLECPVSFGARWNALEMYPDALSWPVRQNPKYVFGMLTERADALVAELTNARSAIGRLRSVLVASLHEGEIGAEKAAKRLGISRQTLFRRLKSEGTTYTEVFDKLRCDMAQEYLKGGKATVEETAYLTGYSDAASFTRAFRRWTGQTPGNFRLSEATRQRTSP